MFKKIIVCALLFFGYSWSENKTSLIFNSNFMTITTDVPLVLNSELIFYRDSLVHTVGAEFTYLDMVDKYGSLWGMAGLFYSREYRNINNSFYWGPLYGLWVRAYTNYPIRIFSLYIGGIKCDYEIGDVFFIKFTGRMLIGLDLQSEADYYSDKPNNKFALGLLPSIGIGLGLKF